MIPPALGDPKSDSNALADDAMIWECGCDHLAHFRFAVAISNGDRRIVELGVDADIFAEVA